MVRRKKQIGAMLLSVHKLTEYR